MSCNEVTIIKTTSNVEALQNQDEKKQGRYDPSIIKDSMIDSLLLGTKAEIHAAFDKLFSKDGPFSGIRSIKDKALSLRNNGVNYEHFGPLLGNIESGEARMLAIALSHLQGVQKAESDSIKKRNLRDNEISAVTDEASGLVQTSYSNVARSIGRDILKSRGYRLIPKSQKGIELAAAQEIAIGEKALDLIASKNPDIVKVNPSGTIVNRDFMTMEDKPEGYTSGAKSKSQNNSKVVPNVKTLVFTGLFTEYTEDLEEYHGNPNAYARDISDTSTRIRAVLNLVVPSNVSNPHTEAQGINEAFMDIEPTEATKVVIEQAQKSPLKVTGMFREFFEQLNEKISTGSDNKTTKSKLGGLIKLVSENSASKYLFGTIDPKEMHALYGTDATGINKEYGVSTSKLLPILNLLDASDTLLNNELFYTYQVASQNRLTVIEQTLNYQTDNFMARNILGSPEVQTLNKEQIDYMLGYLVDETKLSIEEILGTSKSSKKAKVLNSIIEAFNDNEQDTLDIAMGISEMMENNKVFMANDKSKSAFGVMNYAKAIQDIRDGYSKGEVKTNFLVKPDATASGALITVAQASGRTADAGQVILDLIKGSRVFNSEVSEVAEEFKDMYEVSSKAFEANIEKYRSNKEYIGAKAQKERVVYRLIDKLLDDDIGVIGSPRDLIKLPFTKYIYGQSNLNNRIEIAREITSIMIGKNKEPIIREVLGLGLKDKLPEGDDLRTELISALAKDGGVTDTLVTLVDETTGKRLFNDQSELLASIHDIMAKIRYDSTNDYTQIQIVPTLAGIENKKTMAESAQGYAEVRGKFGATIEKWKESVLPSDNNSLTTIKKHFPNMNSIKVLLQHMTDAAILVRSLEAVYARPEFKDYKNGMMLVHDSIGVGSAFAIALEEGYKNQIMVVNSEYDFVEAALYELKYARDQIDAKANPELLAEANKMIDEVSKDLPNIIAEKQRILSTGMIETSFGVKPSIKRDVAEVTTGKVEPVVKPEPSSSTDSKEVPVTVNAREELTNYINNMVKKSPKLANLTKLALSKNPSVKIVIGSNDTKPTFNMETNTITLPSKAKAEVVIHELIHAATAKEIENNPVFRDRINTLFNRAFTVALESADSEGNHFMSQFDLMGENEKLHEFMASGLSSSELSKALVKISVGQKILNKIKEITLKLLGVNKDNYNTVLGQMVEALSDTEVSDGTNIGNGILNFIAATDGNYKPYSPKSSNPEGIGKITRPVSDVFIKVDRKMSDVIQSSLDLSIDLTSNKLGGKKYHKKMMANSRIYKDTYNAISRQWSENTLISKLKIYIGVDDTFDKDTLNKIITQAMHAEERKATFEQEHINKLQIKMKKHFTKDETSSLNALLSETPIFNIEPKMLTAILSGSLSIADAIASIESTSTLTKSQMITSKQFAKDLAEYYIDKTPNSSGRTTDLNIPPTISDTVKQLSALYAMKKVTDVNTLLTKINGSKATQELFNELYEIAVATKALDKELDSTITYEIDKHSGNLSHTVFERNNEVKVVTMKSVDQALSNGLGWEVLRKPTKTQAGIIYRDVGDVSFQSGAGVNLKVDPNLNLTLPSNYEAAANTASPRLKDNARIILSNKELDTLGYVRNPVYSLTKAYTHRMMLLETQSIRELLVDRQVYKDTVNSNKIVKDIKAGKHLWYIKLPEGKTLADMPTEIRARYRVAKSKSDAGNFDDQVSLIRKDIADFVEGYKEIQIGETGSTLNKTFSVLKKAILLQKIHWVITAPAKVARDAVSNVAYLMSKNVPVNVIYSKTKRVMNEMATLTKLREQLLHAEFKNRVSPSSAMKRKINSIEKQIRNHPLAAAHFNGFVQSVAIELSSKNEHTLSGLHKDTSSLLSYLFRDDKGSLNKAGEAIMAMADFSVNGEDLLIAIANKLGAKTKAASPQAIAESLKEMGNHIKEIKKSKDIEAYIQEYLGTPGSSMVAVGSAAVQAVDVVAKVIDYEHNMDIKVKNFVKDKKRKPSVDELKVLSDDAAQEALENFVDYKVNIPREFRFLEQTGVTSFISFTSRIQRIMFRSLRNNPVNAMFTVMLSSMLNIGGGSTIFDANIFERNIFNTPNLGIDVIFPTKVFG